MIARIFGKIKMQGQIKGIIQASIDVKQKILSDTGFTAKIEEVTNIIARAFADGNKVLFCGNGGSAADAQHLKINTAQIGDFLFVARAKVRNFLRFERAVRNIDILSGDINMIKKLFMHKAHITLLFVRTHGVIFVKIKRHDVLEGEAILLMQANELGIYACRR